MMASALTSSCCAQCLYYSIQLAGINLHNCVAESGSYPYDSSPVKQVLVFFTVASQSALMGKASSTHLARTKNPKDKTLARRLLHVALATAVKPSSAKPLSKGALEANLMLQDCRQAVPTHRTSRRITRNGKLFW
jgi:hypothetical protein